MTGDTTVAELDRCLESAQAMLADESRNDRDAQQMLIHCQYVLRGEVEVQ